jgi:hypothetical protein
MRSPIGEWVLGATLATYPLEALFGIYLFLPACLTSNRSALNIGRLYTERDGKCAVRELVRVGTTTQE